MYGKGMMLYEFYENLQFVYIAALFFGIKELSLI